MSLSSFGSLGGQDPFSDLLNRFFGMSPGSLAARRAAGTDRAAAERLGA
ncbi:hypothetical protein [Streptomyces sp. SA3_actF]